MPERPGARIKAQAARVSPRALALLLLLGLFGFYAPALHVPILHDGTFLVWFLRDRHVLGNEPGDAVIRPMSYVPWQLVWILLGWYYSAPVQFFSLAAHIVCVALVIALAVRIGARLGINRWGVGLLAGALFGWYPLSYQNVLWSAALGHPLFTLFGLSAVHAYLTARSSRGRRKWVGLLSASGLVLASGLSHDAGFMSAIWIALVEALYAVSARATQNRHQKFDPSVLVPVAVGIGYAIAYRLGSRSAWSQDTPALLSNPQDVLHSLVYFAQALVVPVGIVLRPIVGLSESRYLVVGIASLLGIVLLWAFLVRRGQWALAWFGVLWWMGSSFLFAAVLPHAHVINGPRLTYGPMVGGVLLWAGVLTLALSVRLRTIAVLAVAGLLTWFAWSAQFILPVMDESLRLGRIMRAIGADLRAAPAEQPVLLINPPMWNAPVSPQLPLGMEGMPIIAEYAPPSYWLGALDGVYRDVRAVQHDISLTYGDRFQYGILGDPADDAALRSAILSARWVYRFDYDPPLGLRATRLAALSTEGGVPMPMVTFTHRSTRVALLDAQIARCQAELVLRLTWRVERPAETPVGVFVHALDKDGAQLWVADRDLVDGYLPLDQLPSGLTLQENRRVPLTPERPVPHAMRVGLYDRSTGERFTAERLGVEVATELKLDVPTHPTHCVD